MATRDVLLQRPDIRNEDIDDLIGIAAELQEANAPGVDVQDVRDVAEELDIEPGYIDQAIQELHKRRAADTEAQAAAAAGRTKALTVAGLSLAGLALLMILFVLSAVPGMRGAAAEFQSAEAQLTVVLDRQAALAPQLVALAGGQASEVSGLAKTQRSASDLTTRLEAASNLATAMATAIAKVPSGDENAQQVRLNLQYEITGSQNRVDTERSRYEQARVGYERSHSGIRASVVNAIGLSD